jgi:hypothetical protein
MNSYQAKVLLCKRLRCSARLRFRRSEKLSEKHKVRCGLRDLSCEKLQGKNKGRGTHDGTTTS